MILSSETNFLSNKIIFYINIFCFTSNIFILLISKKLTKFLGTTGLRVIERIMGMILMVVAIQFIVDGILLIINQYPKIL